MNLSIDESINILNAVSTLQEREEITEDDIKEVLSGIGIKIRQVAHVKKALSVAGERSYSDYFSINKPEILVNMASSYLAAAKQVKEKEKSGKTDNHVPLDEEVPVIDVTKEEEKPEPIAITETVIEKKSSAPSTEEDVPDNVGENYVPTPPKKKPKKKPQEIKFPKIPKEKEPVMKKRQPRRHSKESNMERFDRLEQRIEYLETLLKKSYYHIAKMSMVSTYNPSLNLDDLDLPEE
jgi:hypothetical protein